MSKEEIEKQLKKSRRQNKDERYEYINSHFNQTNYAMELEKYTLKILRKYTQLQNNWNELKKELKEKIDICDGCIDIMQTDLQEIAPRGNGKSYLTSEIFKNKVAKISFEFTLKHMQELEQVKDD